MPIYAYRCQNCGFAKDVLQKMSDAPLTDCPSCNQAAFKKQLTAAGFQLKGTGWYVTDFRGGSSGSGSASTAPAVTEPAAGAGDSNAASGTQKADGTAKADSTATPAA